MLTNCLAACAHLSITISEIQRDICEKIGILSYPLAFDAPVRGVPVGILAPRFGTRKLEWCRYPTVNKFRRYLYSFWRNSRTWRSHRRTDGRTPGDSIYRAYAYASRGKNTYLCMYSAYRPTITWDIHNRPMYVQRLHTISWVGCSFVDVTHYHRHGAIITTIKLQDKRIR